LVVYRLNLTVFRLGFKFYTKTGTAIAIQLLGEWGTHIRCDNEDYLSGHLELTQINLIQ